MSARALASRRASRNSCWVLGLTRHPATRTDLSRAPYVILSAAPPGLAERRISTGPRCRPVAVARTPLHEWYTCAN